MDLTNLSPEELQSSADSTLEEAAARLRGTLVELAARLRPFPSFLGMVSIQAIELEPTVHSGVDRGCVVVCPDGGICELNLQAMAGIEGMSEMDPVEELRELSLPTAEYIAYAAAAIQALGAELRRRGINK